MVFAIPLDAATRLMGAAHSATTSSETHGWDVWMREGKRKPFGRVPLPPFVSPASRWLGATCSRPLRRRGDGHVEPRSGELAADTPVGAADAHGLHESVRHLLCVAQHRIPAHRTFGETAAVQCVQCVWEAGRTRTLRVASATATPAAMPALERVLEPNQEEAVARADAGEMSTSAILEALPRLDDDPTDQSAEAGACSASAYTLCNVHLNPR